MQSVCPIFHCCYSQKPQPNKACTGRWGVCGIFEHFSGFEFFLLPSRVHTRPSASNASRWQELTVNLFVRFPKLSCLLN